MATGENRFTLFGAETPEQVRNRIGKAQMQENLALSQLGPSQLSQFAAASAGNLFGRAIKDMVGYEDPEVARAKKVQEVMKKSSNHKEDQGKYLKSLTENFAEAGLYNESYQALDAWTKYSQMEFENKLREREVGQGDRRLDLTQQKLTFEDQQRRFENEIRDTRLDLDKELQDAQIKKLLAETKKINEDMNLAGGLNLEGLPTEIKLFAVRRNAANSGDDALVNFTDKVITSKLKASPQDFILPILTTMTEGRIINGEIVKGKDALYGFELDVLDAVKDEYKFDLRTLVGGADTTGAPSGLDQIR